MTQPPPNWLLQIKTRKDIIMLSKNFLSIFQPIKTMRGGDISTLFFSLTPYAIRR